MSKTIIPEYIQFDYPRLLLQFSQLSTATEQLIQKYQIAKATAVSLKETVTRLEREQVQKRDVDQQLKSEVETLRAQLAERDLEITRLTDKLSSKQREIESCALSLSKAQEAAQLQTAKIAKLEARVGDLVEKLNTLSQTSGSIQQLNKLYAGMKRLAEVLDTDDMEKVDSSKAVDINSTDWAKFVDGSLV